MSVAFGSRVFSAGFAVNLSETHIAVAQMAAMKKATAMKKVKKAAMKTSKKAAMKKAKKADAKKAMNKSKAKMSKKDATIRYLRMQYFILKEHIASMVFYKKNMACSRCGGHVVCPTCKMSSILPQPMLSTSFACGHVMH